MTIICLQEELDAYGTIFIETENNMERYGDRVKVLEDFIKQNGMQVPEGSISPQSMPVRNEEQVKRYATYQGPTSEETEVPLRLLSAEEKIDELTTMVDNMQQDNITQKYSMADTSDKWKELATHLQKEKQVISEILEGDILKVAANVAEQLHQNENDYQLRGVTSSAIEVFQKISELINSLNQSIQESESECEQSFPQDSNVLKNSTSSQNNSNEQKQPDPIPEKPIERPHLIEQHPEVDQRPLGKSYERKLPPNVEAMM